MHPVSSSCHLLGLRWTEVEDYLARDNRLIVPVGECDQHGPHLPLGATSWIVEALADALAQEFGVLRAPLVPYGVNRPTERPYPGAAGLREKTLHRALNELVASWEAQGFGEFILLTAHCHDPHVEALSTVYAGDARIRVVEVLGMDLSECLDGDPGPQHAGEIETSLLLHLHPRAVRMDDAADYPLEARPGPLARSGLPTLPSESRGTVGHPSLASADKGSRIFGTILSRIRQKVFLAPPGPED